MNQLQLLTKIDLTEAPKCSHIRLGDLDGDGRLEIVILQPDICQDDRYFPHSVSYAAAYNLDGELMWQFGTPDNDNESFPDCNIPAQIFDIDNDGSNEVLIISDGEMLFLDGMTGQLKKKFPLPSPDAHDAIIIADLEGKGYPQNIVLKNKFHQLWAMDSNFNVMWTYKGNIGNYPWPYDINNDGEDELIAGYNVLSGDGDILNSISGESGYAKYIWVGDLYRRGDAQKTITILGDKITALTTSNEILWQNDISAEDIALGNLNPEIQGTEVCYTCDNTAILDCYGAKAATSELKGKKLTAVHNLFSEGRDSLILHGGNSPAILLDNTLTPIYTFPTCNKLIWADLTGDGVADILLLCDDRIEIYSSSQKDLTASVIPYFRPQAKRLYNYTDYACEMEPSQYAMSYITGSDNTDIEAWATNCALGNDIVGDEIISRADFAVLFVSALNLHAYERDNFSDVSGKDYFAEAVGTLKKLGFAEGTLGKFNPHAPMTAEAAVDMIKKAGHNCFCMTEGELTYRHAARIVLELLLR
ncbi:MAG: S-layer homology domain-containing protein [Eubacteriales bacterium]|nr:S-layer homology domain-containing protein [Eubacteriales bacterium]